eukprot:12428502-Alexandrium_andersonii.AAC.1
MSRSPASTNHSASRYSRKRLACPGRTHQSFSSPRTNAVGLGNPSGALRRGPSTAHAQPACSKASKSSNVSQARGSASALGHSTGAGDRTRAETWRREEPREVKRKMLEEASVSTKALACSQVNPSDKWSPHGKGTDSATFWSAAKVEAGGSKE